MSTSYATGEGRVMRSAGRGFQIGLTRIQFAAAGSTTYTYAGELGAALAIAGDWLRGRVIPGALSASVETDSVSARSRIPGAQVDAAVGVSGSYSFVSATAGAGARHWPSGLLHLGRGMNR